MKLIKLNPKITDLNSKGVFKYKKKNVSVMFHNIYVFYWIYRSQN